ncbi:MAG: hypothetical protein A4E42_00675 [Methanoregulaceae archaeon PtaU1.Bin222]|nr:MAG: hypothetical protein A4E42_00675 [Methanoregulaceae archaeon PtaU1.Bin222]
MGIVVVEPMVLVTLFMSWSAGMSEGTNVFSSALIGTSLSRLNPIAAIRNTNRRMGIGCFATR